MKEIPLTQGMVAIVDDEDYEHLMQWDWNYAKQCHRTTGYASRMFKPEDSKPIQIRMHRAIMNEPIGYEIDHINGDGLDNRRNNLRIATRAQNQQSKGKPRNNTSGYKGVSYDAEKDKWRAQIRHNNKAYKLGRYKTKEAAAMAYNEAAIKYHGEFACLNALPPYAGV